MKGENLVMKKTQRPYQNSSLNKIEPSVSVVELNNLRKHTFSINFNLVPITSIPFREKPCEPLGLVVRSCAHFAAHVQGFRFEKVC